MSQLRDEIAALDRAAAMLGGSGGRQARGRAPQRNPEGPRVVAQGRSVPCPQRGGYAGDDYGFRVGADGRTCGLCGVGLNEVRAGRLGHPFGEGHSFVEYLANDRPAILPSGKRAYVDCPEHGPVPPAINRTTRDPAVRKGDGPTGWRGRCGVCGADAPARRIERRAKRGDPSKPDYEARADGRRYCKGVCLNGRTSCDCTACLGRCHGAGVCRGHAP